MSETPIGEFGLATIFRADLVVIERSAISRPP